MDCFADPCELSSQPDWQPSFDGRRRSWSPSNGRAFRAPVPWPGSPPIAFLHQFPSESVPSRALNSRRRVMENVALAEVIENPIEEGRNGGDVTDRRAGVYVASGQPRG